MGARQKHHQKIHVLQIILSNIFSKLLHQVQFSLRTLFKFHPLINFTNKLLEKDMIMSFFENRNIALTLFRPFHSVIVAGDSVPTSFHLAPLDNLLLPHNDQWSTFTRVNRTRMNSSHRMKGLCCKEKELEGISLVTQSLQDLAEFLFFIFLWL